MKGKLINIMAGTADRPDKEGQGFSSVTMAQENHQRLHEQSPRCLTPRVSSSVSDVRV